MKQRSSPIRGTLAGLIAVAGTICVSGCSDSESVGPVDARTTGDAWITGVHFGRLVDVYGYRTLSGNQLVELVEVDVLVGPDINDQRTNADSLPDEVVAYDFISPNPDTLQPRLLIPREIGSSEFQRFFDKLDDNLRPVAPAVFHRDTELYSVVPRNAAIRITFAEPLGIGDEFFVERNPGGTVVALKNTEAVQLLDIVGDPTDGDPRGDFVVIPARVIPRGDTLTLDPVLIGSEGPQHRTRNRATGLPESAARSGANIRIAIALEGPLAIPGVHETREAFIGANNAGLRSTVRDFRSGNREDDSADLARGFVRDPDPPRLLGEIGVFIERVDRLDESTLIVTLYKDGRAHDLDQGDVVRIHDPSPGLDSDTLFATGEIVDEPGDDLGRPAVQHVRVLVRNLVKVDTIAVDGEVVERRRSLEDLDPSNHPDYPNDQRERETWLRQNAPRAAIVAEFTGGRRRPDGGIYGDDPIHFVRFTPGPAPDLNGQPSPPGTNVSPFAGAVVRFTKPIDLTTARSLDTMFFATRDLFDREAIRREVIEPRQLDPSRFNWDKFWTPHLIVSRIFDEGGSQTSLRLQPALGFFLSDEMRPPDTATRTGQTFRSFPYYLHLQAGPTGIKDLAGNSLDLQPGPEQKDSFTIPFTLDTRSRPDGLPIHPNNLVVNIPRRFADEDEDEQPSVYRDEEMVRLSDPFPPEASLRNPDVFGAVSYLNDGRLLARPATRVTKVVDDLNQESPPPQGTDRQFCPISVYGAAQIATPSAAVRFAAPIQNPLNPFGARLQTLWREIDLNLSRTDPFDFNLDVEQMYWAPFTGDPIRFDEFDRVSLFLSHSERRPEPCVGLFSALPSMPKSGLSTKPGDPRGAKPDPFSDNVAHDLVAHDGSPFARQIVHSPQVPAFLDERLTIDPGTAVLDPTGTNRFLPLPEFQQPYFVWRDEMETVQGGPAHIGTDVQIVDPSLVVVPYIPSPWLAGQGRSSTVDATTGEQQRNRGTWLNFTQFLLQRRSRNAPDWFTGGGLGAIALPLLADFWVYPDDPDLPAGFGFRASGINGWQISLAGQSAPQPNFRVYSSGFAGYRRKRMFTIAPGSAEWVVPSGGFTPTGAPTSMPAGGDNSVYWIMADFLKRRTVLTAGFVEILNPHRMPPRIRGEGDPRLGPYFVDDSGESRRPAGVLPAFDWTMEPVPERLPRGTAVIPEFRASGPIDDKPWRSVALGVFQTGGEPDEINFPLDPLKAGDAYLRKFDDRSFGTPNPRNYWTHYYMRNLTGYTAAADRLMDDDFIRQFAGPRDRFTAEDVRYFNWRFIMRNNVESNPPISPAIESFAVVYRFERR